MEFRQGKSSSLEGFEPPAFWFVAKRSIQLSYRLVGREVAIMPETIKNM